MITSVAELLSGTDMKNFEKELAAAVENAGSLNKLELWLKSQHNVKSVKQADYLLKSYPPQREFIVEFTMPDNSTVTKIVNIFDLGNGKFQFNEIRNQ